MTSSDLTMMPIEGEVQIWMTPVCAPRLGTILEVYVTRFLLVAGLTESPGSLGSLVGTASEHHPSAADWPSIWRLCQQTRKLAKRGNERIHQPPPVRFTCRPGRKLTNEHSA